MSIYQRLSRFFMRISNSAFYWSTALVRKDWVKNTLIKKIVHLNNEGLTGEQLKAVKDYWRGYKVNLDLMQFYNQSHSSEPFDARYVPDSLYYCCVTTYYNRVRDTRAIDNKNFYDLYFPGVRQPKTIAHIIGGVCLDEQYHPFSLESAFERCRACGEVVCKPSVSAATGGGSGIKFWDKSQGDAALEEILIAADNAIIQELFHQHPALGRLHENSVNTIRIMTWFHDGEVEVLSPIVRMGIGDTRVDNVSQGGYYCGVNDDGTLKRWGYTDGGEPHLSHPQGAVFADCAIPNFNECKEMVRLLAYRFVRESKLISWDLAIDEGGHPVLIEANMTNGAIDFHQKANGPIFGDRAFDVVSEVLKPKRQNRFYRYLLP